MPSLEQGGGVTTVARFLCDLIDASSRFECRLFSIPSSYRDSASRRLLAPNTWFRGPQVREATWEGRSYEHVGANWVELEFQRYRPRSILTNRLRKCDLVQVVAGSPAWGLVAQCVDLPVALQVATLSSVERRERLRREGGLITHWRQFMTQFTDRLDRNGIRAADCIFVENTWMKRTVQEWTDSERVYLAPPGVDTEFFRPSRDGVNTDRDYILSVGRFADRRKNVPLLFEAYARLHRTKEDPPPLLMAGKTGPRAGDWRMADDLGIRDRIQFHENVPRQRLAELYRRASFFVLASSEEGLGIVLLEAMASGLPVVSTATEGACEAVEDGTTGIITPLNDAGSLSQAMRRLVVNRTLRAKMGRRARARVRAKYSREAAGRRFLAGYRALLNRTLLNPKDGDRAENRSRDSTG